MRVRRCNICGMEEKPTSNIPWYKSKAFRYAAEYLGTTLGMVALVLIVRFGGVPNPNMILITGLVVSTALFGFGPGSIAAIIMVIYTMYFFSTDNSFFSYTEINVQKLWVSVIGIVISLGFTGNLHRLHHKATKKLKEANDMLQKDNEALQQSSLIDDLTKAKNRSAYHRDVNFYIGKEIVFAVLDIDDFKSFNDNQGHAMGDLVLHKVSMTLQAEFGTDNVYRYGGDEFIIVSTDKDIDTFLGDLKDARAFLLNENESQSQVRISLSVGYCYGKVDGHEDMHLMFAAADHDLYQSKASGKGKSTGSAYSRYIASNYLSELAKHHGVMVNSKRD